MTPAEKLSILKNKLLHLEAVTNKTDKDRDDIKRVRGKIKELNFVQVVSNEGYLPFAVIKRKDNP